MKFSCTGCGACCRKISSAVEMVKPYANNPAFAFPYGWDESGVCEMLEDNKCKVYENRPLICNVEKLVDYLKVDKHSFYELNAKACNDLMDNEKLPQDLRIKGTPWRLETPN